MDMQAVIIMIIALSIWNTLAATMVKATYMRHAEMFYSVAGIRRSNGFIFVDFAGIVGDR
jgi:hypothetical protein